jgi:sulfite dehydrogenase (quinone) subunit SoeC
MQSPSHPQACAPTTTVETSAPRPPAYPASLLRVLALCGHGLWLLLGLALALGIYRGGRSEALLPLALGAAFVSLGLLAACLRLPAAPAWHGWRPGWGSRPPPEALLALAAYLPMLAVAGLVRGDNAFWATRLAGAALAACSVASLVYTVQNYRRGLSAGVLRRSAQLPASRLVAACYTGGLWLWLCLALQDGAVHATGSRPWIMVLLVLVLLLGLIEGLRWQALGQPDGRPSGPPAPGRAARFVAALFTYALPSLALLVVDLSDAGVPLVAVAAVSCLLGRTVEQRAYESALARLCHAERTASAAVRRGP